MDTITMALYTHAREGFRYRVRSSNYRTQPGRLLVLALFICNPNRPVLTHIWKHMELTVSILTLISVTLTPSTYAVTYKVRPNFCGECPQDLPEMP